MNKQEIEELLKRVDAKKGTRYVHTPYGELTGLLPDFEVEYEFDCDDELKDVKPHQGMRCDFLYEGDDPRTDGIHMIWPELLDENGQVILDKRIKPSNIGKATMWIGLHDMRVKLHRHRITVGKKGYWVIGSKKLAKVSVTKILGLFENEK